MSWDVAFYGELSFPSPDAIARWRKAAVDPAPEAPFKAEVISGTVDDVLNPLADHRHDWFEAIARDSTVTIQDHARQRLASFAAKPTTLGRQARLLLDR
jgi:hypothetical protein